MDGSLDLAMAEQFFEEADRLFDRDRGRLWGVSLDGPMLLVDLDTRFAAASQGDARAALGLQGSVWTGVIPDDVVVANTAMTWSGVHWTVLLWQSIPDDPQHRARFMAHEAFHRVQDRIGLPWPTLPNANGHLDTLDGRYWLQLEWRALSAALEGSGSIRPAAIADALRFRAVRRSVFPSAATDERSLEMHEGLAEYTGFRLSRSTADLAAQQLQTAAERYPSFVRSFAYASGPAYGLLLDAARPGWQRSLQSNDDLGSRLQDALAIADLPALSPDAAATHPEQYGGDRLRAAEEDRQRQRAKEIADYRKRLLDGPVLILPISGDVQCAFDPRTALPIADTGTVFPFVEIRDAWGVLSVKQGGLWMAEDWRTAHVPAPAKGESIDANNHGWRLQLFPEWEMTPALSGNWTLTRRAAG